MSQTKEAGLVGSFSIASLVSLAKTSFRRPRGEEKIGVVLAFMDCLVEQDYGTALYYLKPDFAFRGPGGSFDGAYRYLEFCHSKAPWSYRLLETVVEGNAVVVKYESPATSEATQYLEIFRLSDGKIARSEAFVLKPKASVNEH